MKNSFTKQCTWLTAVGYQIVGPNDLSLFDRNDSIRRKNCHWNSCHTHEQKPFCKSQIMKLDKYLSQLHITPGLISHVIYLPRNISVFSELSMTYHNCCTESTTHVYSDYYYPPDSEGKLWNRPEASLDFSILLIRRRTNTNKHWPLLCIYDAMMTLSFSLYGVKVCTQTLFQHCLCGDCWLASRDPKYFFS